MSPVVFTVFIIEGPKIELNTSRKFTSNYNPPFKYHQNITSVVGENYLQIRILPSIESPPPPLALLLIMSVIVRKIEHIFSENIEAHTVSVLV
jgi:hypothetical protein